MNDGDIFACMDCLTTVTDTSANAARSHIAHSTVSHAQRVRRATTLRRLRSCGRKNKPRRTMDKAHTDVLDMQNHGQTRNGSCEFSAMSGETFLGLGGD